MEHLHPDDAATQLCNIFRALKPGGRYLCITPNMVSGPPDISQFFYEEATGLHLREYTYAELVRLMRQVGFRHFRVLLTLEGCLAQSRCRQPSLSRWRSDFMPRSLTRARLGLILLGITILAET